jgi:hypothetical protein
LHCKNYEESIERRALVDNQTITNVLQHTNIIPKLGRDSDISINSVQESDIENAMSVNSAEVVSQVVDPPPALPDKMRFTRLEVPTTVNPKVAANEKFSINNPSSWYFPTMTFAFGLSSIRNRKRTYQ